MATERQGRLAHTTGMGGDIRAHEDRDGVSVRASNFVFLTPEDAIRFGFHLAGLGAKALRAQR